MSRLFYLREGLSGEVRDDRQVFLAEDAQRMLRRRTRRVGAVILGRLHGQHRHGDVFLGHLSINQRHFVAGWVTLGWPSSRLSFAVSVII